jgi:hypothetical protein
MYHTYTRLHSVAILFHDKSKMCRWLSFTVFPRIRVIPRLPVCRALLLTHEDQPPTLSLTGGRHVQSLPTATDFKNIKVTLLSSQVLDICVDTKISRTPSPKASPRNMQSGGKVRDSQPVSILHHPNTICICYRTIQLTLLMI